MKQVTINKENPLGVVSEYVTESEEDIVVEIPTPEQRLEALEAAMLELIMRGGAG
jgi:hypothetical protein